MLSYAWVYLDIPNYISDAKHKLPAEVLLLRILCRRRAAAGIEVSVADLVYNLTIFSLGAWVYHAQYYPSLVGAD